MHLTLVPSVIFHEYRIRCVGNKIYHRPPSETFHDFLERFAIDILDRDWFDTQRGMSTERQHIVVRFAIEYNRAKRDGSIIDVRQELDGNMSGIPSGRNLYWLLFCFDLFRLKSKNLLTSDLIDRLKNNQYFEGARYELAVMVVLLSANCDVKWIDVSTEKTCDIEAIHKNSGIKLVVEAKSKKRSNDSKRGLAPLVNEALKKSVPSDAQLIVFIEANLPFEPVSTENKRLLNEVKRVIGVQPEVGDKFHLLVVTNFPFYYDHLNSPASPPEDIFVLPKNNMAPLAILNDLRHALDNYAKIPEVL